MNTSQTMQERADHQIGLAVQDVSTADVTGPWHSMAGYGRVLAAVVTDTLAVDDVVTVTLQQATDDSGTDAKDLGSAVSVTATAAEASQLLAEAKASDLDDGFTHVAIKVGATPDGATTINAGGALVRGDGSYRPS